MTPQVLKIAFCTANEVTLSDFIPPGDILAGINIVDNPDLASLLGSSDSIPYRVLFDHLAPTMDPINPLFGPLGPAPTREHGILDPKGPRIVPTGTYREAMEKGLQYDILWVPAGGLPDPKTGGSRIPSSQIQFLQNQAPKAKYIISVCAGSAILAEAGILEGKKATTNKSCYRQIVSAYPTGIMWTPKARWVVDGNIWTSSGVTAGTDMALAFVEHLVGKKVADIVRGQTEVIEHDVDDDPFAGIHGLLL